MENVPALMDPNTRGVLDRADAILQAAGFVTKIEILDAAWYGVPQRRPRLFHVSYNGKFFGDHVWKPPARTVLRHSEATVGQAIGGLPEPTYFSRKETSRNAFHPNHWCMVPKSWRFSTPGALVEGSAGGRSFKVLARGRPSLAVSYGNREVHIHPGCHRRLTVYEAMLLQGFPSEYVLSGSLSSQITQVSEAVPPALAEAVAGSILSQWPTAFAASISSASHARYPLAASNTLS
jgi:DNA (cytosine-5)-methyltransferase 1